jgi:hypothetical protein
MVLTIPIALWFPTASYRAWLLIPSQAINWTVSTKNYSHDVNEASDPVDVRSSFRYVSFHNTTTASVARSSAGSLSETGKRDDDGGGKPPRKPYPV